MRTLIMLLLCFSSSLASASDWDTCDNKIEFENGEKPGRFLWLQYAVSTSAYAEKLCGISSEKAFTNVLKAIEENGCSAETEIYEETASSIALVREKPIQFLMEAPDATESEIAAGSKHILKTFGGCEKLRRVVRFWSTEGFKP